MTNFIAPKLAVQNGYLVTEIGDAVDIADTDTAQRIAASWNACRTSNVEQIAVLCESSGFDVKGLLAHANEMHRQRDWLKLIVFHFLIVMDAENDSVDSPEMKKQLASIATLARAQIEAQNVAVKQ